MGIMTNPESHGRPEIGDIREFWDQQAETYGTDMRAVMPDQLLKGLELRALRDALDPTKPTLEAGCGNAVNLLPLAETFTGALTGFDYSNKMIDAARQAVAEAGRTDIHLHVADILDPLGFLGSFSQVYTVRCLINLPDLDLQLRAAGNLLELVEAGGRLALLECTQQGLANLNAMRAHVDLPAIENHWHNLYLDEAAFLAGMKEKAVHVETVKFSSLYYLISRVFNALLTPPGESPDYLAEVNRIAARLPSVGDFGPHQLFIFEKA